MHASAPKAQLAANRRRTTSIGTNVTSQTRILKKQSPSKCGEIAEMFLYQTRGHAHNVCDLSGGGALPMMSFSGPFTCGWGIPHHDVARAQGATHIDRPIVRDFGVPPKQKQKKKTSERSVYVGSRRSVYCVFMRLGERCCSVKTIQSCF